MSYQSKWATPVSGTTVLSTELNSLPNSSTTFSAPGTELDNSTIRNQLWVAEFTGSFSVAPTANGLINIYAIQAPDGTNYEDGSASVDPGVLTFVCAIPVRAVTTAQRRKSLPFQLLPYKTKFIAQDQTGQAMASSGNVIKVYPYSEEFS